MTLLNGGNLEAAQRGARILLVEDDDSAARVMRTILEQAGHAVDVLRDGEEAVRRLEDGDLPDLLVLDWMLPGLTGLEVCHRARARWDPLTLPILIVTARTDPESVYAAFDAGASDYVAKPFRGAEIRARIAAHLRTKRLVEEQRRLEEHLGEREKLSALGLLAGGVAHDLNNPLSVIGGHAQLLASEVDSPDGEAHLRSILGAVERCRRIVGDLLAFAKRRPPERSPVALGDVVRTVLALRESELRGRGTRVDLELDGGLPLVVADPHQLEQVFLNVLLNAEQALRDGGGSTLRLGTRLEEGWVIGEIANDGPPIPAATLPRIFEPFFTTKSAEEGTGLGLAISRRIARAHGGEMEVESGGGWTAFRLLLPPLTEG